MMDILRNRLACFVRPIETWIDDYINLHEKNRMRVADIGFPHLPRYFSETVLSSSYAVYVDQIKAPPLGRFGLEGFSFFDSLEPWGITYKNTVFITRDQAGYESIHFHELIHTIQWGTLGAEVFILAYAMGLLQFGYHQCPLETIAYQCQAKFDRGVQIEALESRVRSHCRKFADSLGLT